MTDLSDYDEEHARRFPNKCRMCASTLLMIIAKSNMQLPFPLRGTKDAISLAMF